MLQLFFQILGVVPADQCSEGYTDEPASATGRNGGGREHGAHIEQAALIAVFLYARALKLPLLPMMVHYFGFACTVTVSVCIVVSSVLSGLLIGRLASHEGPRRTGVSALP